MALIDPSASPRPRLGRVASFDPERGLGEIAGDDDTVLAFHATAIADGTRAIDTGTRVTYVVVAGRQGSLEARAVTRVPS